MKKILKFFCTYIFLLSIMTHLPELHAQVTETDSVLQVVIAPDIAPFVYLDCGRCDYNYIRTEITFVNYVRDPELADIHVFVSDVPTAGGGREYQFSFIGRRAFSGTAYTLKHHIDHNATFEEARIALLTYLKMGFASFMLQTPLGIRFSIDYIDTGEEISLQDVHDPWDYWIFQAYVGSVELEKESQKSEFESRWGFFADRVNDKWKFRIRPYFNFGRLKIQTSDLDEPAISTERRHGLETHAIKSLNDHWSLGLFGTYSTDNRQNIKHEMMISPGIEYSIFPYDLSTRKAITFTYQLRYGYYDYYEETIYSKTSEGLLNHNFQAMVNIRQPWGNIETGLVGSQYLHDMSRSRLEFLGSTSFRLFEGFSMRFQAEYNIVRDQLSLPKGEASLEEVLLRQRELATDYSFSGSVAITYTFGSKFANIVNTRF